MPRVELDKRHCVEGHGSGQMHILCMRPGDKVTVELTPDDLSRARMAFRAK